jgi:F-type H+-transporting ATPase subunit c
MSLASKLFWVLVVLFVGASPSFAAEGAIAGIGMGLSIVGIGIGIGLVGHSALAGIARQPEQAGRIQGQMILLAALVEGAGIIAIVLCFVLGQ